MKLRSVVLVELQQSQYAQSILKKRASSGIVHHLGKYDTFYFMQKLRQTRSTLTKKLFLIFENQNSPAASSTT